MWYVALGWHAIEFAKTSAILEFYIWFRFWVSQKLYKTEIQLHWTITRGLLSRRLRQRERLHASVLSICSFVCLSVSKTLYKVLGLSVAKMQKKRFSQKLSNLELWCLSSTYRKLCDWALQRTQYWIPKIQDAWDPPSWKSTWRHFFLPRVVRSG